MKKILLSCAFAVVFSNLTAQLVIYQNLNQTGVSATCVSNTIYKGTAIPGGLNDGIKSITLSQGYMATMAANENGTGESFCYVASVSNLSVNLAYALQNKVSFIRVLPITNVKKKGLCHQVNLMQDTLNCSWFYDWGTNDVSSPTSEYALMTWGSSWVTETKIDQYIAKPDITTIMSFNEPDATGQANILVNNAVPLYKKVLRTGYRMGSPATTEGEWDNWLLDFVNLARADTLRVDYISIHWYDWGNWLSNPTAGNTAPNVNNVLTRLKNYINAVYNLYKKPICITEFNCNKNRTLQTHLDFMAIALPYLDSDPRIERYAYFFEDDIPPTANATLTPIGQLYKNHGSTSVFNDNIYDTRSASPEIVSWNTSAVTGGGQSVPELMPTYVAPNLTVANGLQRGAGTTFSPFSVSNGYWGSNGFARLTAAHGIDSNKILTFSLQSTNGKEVSYTTIDSFKIRIANTGPIKYQIDYSINNGTFVPITTVTGPSRTTGNYSLPPVNLSGITALQNVPPTSVVTFRITPFDCSGDGVFYFGAGPSDVNADLNVTGVFTDNFTLPITLTSFQSHQIDGKVKLSWQTQSETNCSHFLLERSTDQRNFDVIANIRSTGRPNGDTYTYIDAPNTDAPKYYYRLKIVYYDGQYEYSKILVEHFKQDNKLSIYPTLVSGTQITALFGKVVQQTEMSIINSDGKQIKRINLMNGSTQQIIDLSGLSSGSYLLVLRNAQGVQTHKFIKQ